MKLFEHDEFEQAILQAATRLGVSEQFVEKDYYVTEILRIVVEQLGGKAVFKGGTSLSKGWGLINRSPRSTQRVDHSLACAGSRARGCTVRFPDRPRECRSDWIEVPVGGTAADNTRAVRSVIEDTSDRPSQGAESLAQPLPLLKRRRNEQDERRRPRRAATECGYEACTSTDDP